MGVKKDDKGKVDDKDTTCRYVMCKCMCMHMCFAGTQWVYTYLLGHVVRAREHSDLFFDVDDNTSQHTCGERLL